MRVVNIGFNVQTDKAVKSLTDIEKKLISINTALEEKHKIQIDSSGIENSIKKIKDSVSKTKDIEIISDKSINSSINKIEVLNEEITKMRTTLNKPNNISDKSVLEFSKKLYDLTKRLESMKEVTSDKDLMKGLNSKELAILNVEMKDLTSQTNKIKSIMSGLTDNSLNFIKSLENTNVKASILEKTLEEIKRQAIIEGKIDIKTNSEQTLKDLQLLKSKVVSAYNTKDMFDLNEIDSFISKIDSKSKQLKKDMVAPIKSILTQARVGDIYSVQEMPKVAGISSLSKSLRVMSLEINDIVSNMSDKGFHEISNDASVLNSRVLELVNSLSKVKTESEIPEVIHQFNTLKNELKDIKKIQSESDMKTVKSILTPQKQGVLYSAQEKPRFTGLDSSKEQLAILEIQINKLANTDPTKRLEAGLKDVSAESLKLISEINKLKISMGTVDDKSDIPKIKSQLIEVRQEFNKLNKLKLDILPKENRTSINDLIGTYAIFNTAKAQLSNFMELEDATYNLGVVAQFSEYQIQQMRQSIIDMSTDLPQSSIEITKAMDAVMRTGKSYEEARVIVQKTSKLATASGESLGDAVSIVNKLFLALGVNATKAEDVDRALQQMHATAVFTATDLEGLGISAQQYAGALSTLAKTTSYSGKELDDYKIGLLALGTTFSGILSNMGKRLPFRTNSCKRGVTKVA